MNGSIYYDNTLRFQAAWLNVPPERLIEENHFVHPTKIRGDRIPGYAKPFQVYALRMEGKTAVYAACVPALENELHRRLEKIKPTTAALWFEALNPAIDTSRARPLNGKDIGAFVRFHQEAYPECKNIDWVPDYARKLIGRDGLFGIFEGCRLVCAADLPDTPYLPELIAEPGIFTLREHRRKGYAAAVCAALIQAQLQRGRTPYWSCGADNAASINLAKHLGFQPFGDIWRLEHL